MIVEKFIIARPAGNLEFHLVDVMAIRLGNSSQRRWTRLLLYSRSHWDGAKSDPCTNASSEPRFLHSFRPRSSEFPVSARFLLNTECAKHQGKCRHVCHKFGHAPVIRASSAKTSSDRCDFVTRAILFIHRTLLALDRFPQDSTGLNQWTLLDQSRTLLA